jgi:hypothetical protein
VDPGAERPGERLGRGSMRRWGRPVRAGGAAWKCTGVEMHESEAAAGDGAKARKRGGGAA